ncbi:MAG: type II/IV secretion system protein [Candidatus Doudnabacteria bacterium]|nr:type II/IV secretion system protein [Candidatus Doudnabacteria bacterium]
MTKHHFLPGTKEDLQRALSDVNHKMQEEETKAKAAALGLPYVDLHNFPIDFNVLGIFTEEEAKAAKAVPFYKEQNDLRVGVVDPQNSLLKLKQKELADKNQVSLYLISPLSLIKTLALYAKVLKPKIVQDETLRIGKQADFTADIAALKTISAQKQKSVSEIMEVIFGAALEFRASDIHFEPEENFIKLRFRVDGVLQDILHLDKNSQKSLVSRLKILAKLKLNLSDEPQDGRLTFYFSNKPVDVRVSILPSSYGEEIVMRLLNTDTAGLKLHELGLSKQAEALLQKILNRPNGMVITTGPTGSGKTTTLYACLNQLNEPGVKIITLEDPVEYKLEGIVQTPISHEHNFDFAKGLRAVLRQDPDIVMVGEIRDQETAETAMQAALTGHLVLSTLHTNDASGAIPRLLNMGVKPFVAAPALSLVVAQRLARRLCEFCKKEAKLAPSLMEKVVHILKTIPASAAASLPKSFQFFHSSGCKKCGNLGYKGRVGIYEFLENTEAIQTLIFKEASMSDFKRAAVAQGMLTMAQDGLLKALEGITDVEEIFRVAGEE